MRQLISCIDELGVDTVLEQCSEYALHQGRVEQKRLERDKASLDHLQVKARKDIIQYWNKTGLVIKQASQKLRTVC
jgi:hypothetical protein